MRVEKKTESIALNPSTPKQQLLNDESPEYGEQISSIVYLKVDERIDGNGKLVKL